MTSLIISANQIVESEISIYDHKSQYRNPLGISSTTIIDHNVRHETLEMVSVIIVKQAWLFFLRAGFLCPRLYRKM